MLLKDKVIIVTGGGRGIGAAIVRVLAREGAQVAINCCTSTDKAEALACAVTDYGGRAKAYCCDIRDQEAVKRMVEEVVQDFGRIDAVINNAISGISFQPVENTTWPDYLNSFDFSTKAVLNTLTAVRPVMKQQGGGRIINIVTDCWNSAGPNTSVYVSGKGAMVGFSRSLAAELGPENITVNMVAPGWMKDDKVGPEVDTTEFVKQVPLGRQGDAEEIGNACAFLASDLAGFITGAYIPVCGGIVRQMGS